MEAHWRCSEPCQYESGCQVYRKPRRQTIVMNEVDSNGRHNYITGVKSDDKKNHAVYVDLDVLIPHPTWMSSLNTSCDELGLPSFHLSG